MWRLLCQPNRIARPIAFDRRLRKRQMRNKPSPADIDLAINQAKHGGWIDPTDEPDGWECLLAKPTGGAMRALCLILALVALMPQARAQPFPPDQACSEIVKTL